MNGPDLDVRQSVPTSYRSHYDRGTELLIAYRIPVTLAALAVAVLVVTGRASVPTPPEQVTQIIRGFAVGIVPATIVGKVAIVDKFIPDDRMRVLELSADEDGVTAEPYKVPRGAWESRRRGDRPELRPEHGKTDAVVTDLEHLEDVGVTSVEGCPQEIANPVDVLTRDGKLGEVYGDLLDDRQELTRLKASMTSKAVEWEAENVNNLLAAVEHGTAFETSSMTDRLADESWSDIDEPDADDADPSRSDERRTLSDLEHEQEEETERGDPSNGDALLPEGVK